MKKVSELFASYSALVSGWRKGGDRIGRTPDIDCCSLEDRILYSATPMPIDIVEPVPVDSVGYELVNPLATYGLEAINESPIVPASEMQARKVLASTLNHAFEETDQRKLNDRLQSKMIGVVDEIHQVFDSNSINFGTDSSLVVCDFDPNIFNQDDSLMVLELDPFGLNQNDTLVVCDFDPPAIDVNRQWEILSQDDVQPVIEVFRHDDSNGDSEMQKYLEWKSQWYAKNGGSHEKNIHRPGQPDQDSNTNPPQNNFIVTITNVTHQVGQMSSVEVVPFFDRDSGPMIKRFLPVVVEGLAQPVTNSKVDDGSPESNPYTPVAELQTSVSKQDFWQPPVVRPDSMHEKPSEPVSTLDAVRKMKSRWSALNGIVPRVQP